MQTETKKKKKKVCTYKLNNSKENGGLVGAGEAAPYCHSIESHEIKLKVKVQKVNRTKRLKRTKNKKTRTRALGVSFCPFPTKSAKKSDACFFLLNRFPRRQPPESKKYMKEREEKEGEDNKGEDKKE